MLYRQIQGTFNSYNQIWSSRDNPTDGEILKLNDVESIRNSHWNATKQTIIVTHGWTHSGEAPVCTTIRDGKYIDAL